MKVPADTGRVIPSAQWVLQALDQVTEVVEGLENLCALVKHGKVHRWFMLDDGLRVSRVIRDAPTTQLVNRNLNIFTTIDPH